MQMKQAQPYYNPNTGLDVRASGPWRAVVIVNDWNDLWTAPAQQNSLDPVRI